MSPGVAEVRTDSGLSQKVISSVPSEQPSATNPIGTQQASKTDARGVKRDDFAVCGETSKAD